MSQYGSIMNGPEVISGAVLEIEDFTMDHVSSKTVLYCTVCTCIYNDIEKNLLGATSSISIFVSFGRWAAIFPCTFGLKRPKSQRRNIFEIQKSDRSTPKAKGPKRQRGK